MTLTDPVCGMTVDDSALRAEGYDDFGFCSEGCRRAFLAEKRKVPVASDSHECCGGGHGGHQPNDQKSVTS